MKLVDILELADLYLKAKKDSDFSAREQELLRSINKSLERIIKVNAKVKRNTEIHLVSEYYH